MDSSHLLDRCSSTEPHPQPGLCWNLDFAVQLLYDLMCVASGLDASVSTSLKMRSFIPTCLDSGETQVPKHVKCTRHKV